MTIVFQYFIIIVCHKKQNKKVQLTKRNFLDNRKTEDINVYTFIFLRKIPRINIYPLIEKALVAFPLFALSDEQRPNVCATALQT